MPASPVGSAGCAGYSSFSRQFHRRWIVHVGRGSTCLRGQPSGRTRAAGGTLTRAGNPARPPARCRRTARLSTTARRTCSVPAPTVRRRPRSVALAVRHPAPIAISNPGGFCGTDLTAQMAAAALSSAAAQTTNGCRGSSIRAAVSKVQQHATMTTAAAIHSCRSRTERCRTVQPRITQSRLKTRVPFVPPKPNEFFSAMSIFIDRAVLAQ